MDPARHDRQRPLLRQAPPLSRPLITARFPPRQTALQPLRRTRRPLVPRSAHGGPVRVLSRPDGVAPTGARGGKHNRQRRAPRKIRSLAVSRTRCTGSMWAPPRTRRCRPGEVARGATERSGLFSTRCPSRLPQVGGGASSKSEWQSSVVDVALIVAARSFAVFKMKLVPGDVRSENGTNVVPSMTASIGIGEEVVLARPKGQECLLAFEKHSRFQRPSRRGPGAYSIRRRLERLRAQIELEPEQNAGFRE